MIGNLGSWVVHVRAKRCSARPVANMGSMGRERDVIPGVISVPAGHVFAGIRETNEEKRRKSGVFEAGGPGTNPGSARTGPAAEGRKLRKPRDLPDARQESIRYIQYTKEHRHKA